MPSLSYHKNVFSFLWSRNEKTIYPLSQSVFHHFHQMFTEQSQSSEHEDESMPCPGLTCDFLRKALLGQPYVLCCCSSVTSHVRLLVAPGTAARQASLSLTVSWSLFKLMSIELVMPSNHLILCCPLLLLPSIFPNIRGFSNEPALHIRWPNDWSLSFSISPSKECSGLIYFRNDWFHLLEVQGTLKSLLQNHSSKASILGHSAFFMVQLSHPYRTTGKTIALARWTFVSKVMFLFFCF